MKKRMRFAALLAGGAVLFGTLTAMPVSGDASVSKESYGLAFDMPSDTMELGEVQQLGAVGEGDYYLPDSLMYDSERHDIAMVFPSGCVLANSAGTVTVKVKAKLNPEKVALSADDDGIRTAEMEVTVTDKTDLTDEQNAMLKALEKKETMSLRFWRAKAVIKGVVAVDAPRLDLETVGQIIKESGSFAELNRKLTDLQPYPDFGMGQHRQSIRYQKMNPDVALQESRYLYPAALTGEQIDVSKPLSDYAYCVYNDTVAGDMNCDGEFGIADAVLLQKWLLCNMGMRYLNWETADFDKDGRLTAIDLTLMQRELLNHRWKWEPVKDTDIFPPVS